jgi:hypothetical protein
MYLPVHQSPTPACEQLMLTRLNLSGSSPQLSIACALLFRLQALELQQQKWKPSAGLCLFN